MNKATDARRKVTKLKPIIASAAGRGKGYAMSELEGFERSLTSEEHRIGF